MTLLESFSALYNSLVQRHVSCSRFELNSIPAAESQIAVLKAAQEVGNTVAESLAGDVPSVQKIEFAIRLLHNHQQGLEGAILLMKDPELADKFGWKGSRNEQPDAHQNDSHSEEDVTGPTGDERGYRKAESQNHE